MCIYIVQLYIDIYIHSMFAYMLSSKVFLSPAVLRPDPSNIETQHFNVMDVDLGAAKLPEERRQAAQVRGSTFASWLIFVEPKLKYK